MGGPRAGAGPKGRAVDRSLCAVSVGWDGGTFGTHNAREDPEMRQQSPHRLMPHAGEDTLMQMKPTTQDKCQNGFCCLLWHALRPEEFIKDRAA